MVIACTIALPWSPCYLFQEVPAQKVTRKQLLRLKNKTMWKELGHSDPISFCMRTSFLLCHGTKNAILPIGRNASSARKEQAGWTCEVCGAKQGEIRWGK